MSRSISRRRLRLIAPLAAAAVFASSTLPAPAATTEFDPGDLELANAQLSLDAATQGMVLLENADTGLPMADSGNVAVFGVGAYKTVKGGTGSGAVNNRYTISVRQGLENHGYTVTTSEAYWDAMTAAYDAKYPDSSGSMFGPTVDYSSVEQPLTAETVAPTSSTDTAIFVVARNSGEGSDRSSGPGDYELTDVEKANIELIGQSYKRVIVVLNVGGIVDTTFYKDINADAVDPDGNLALDSLLLMSQAGQESGNALVEVLNGDVNPSGKLTDTWASAYDYYPAAETFGSADADTHNERYTEGVYVGYRYFDSFYASLDADPASVVNYPFGYGLSYSTFDVKTQQVKADMSTVSVKVKVTNTGKTSGKEVVEVYFSAPQTGIDKPYQELAGYAKTDLLRPGQSQTVTISFDTTEMSSYNEDAAAYVMDAGDYLIRVGNSSRDTEVAAKVRLGSTVTTEQVSTQLDDPAIDTLVADPAEFYTYPGEAKEIKAARVVPLNTKGFSTLDSASAFEQSVAVDSDSIYCEVACDELSSVPVYLDPDQSDWEDTGAAYAPKTGEVVTDITPATGATLFDVAKGDVSMEEFVAGLSVEQLANIVEGTSTRGTTLTAVGAAGYTTPAYESLGIPAMTLSDGPAGLRISQSIAGDPVTYQWATAWPIGTLLAQAWDPALVAEVGDAIGQEMVEYGATLWLAPGMNIHRDPLNGRNFEYYSEDPLLSGLTAAAATRGVQSNPGVGVTIKHYVANSQESERSGGISWLDERTAREIYLKGFQIAVETAQPMAIMTSYNRINGTFASGNYDMNMDLLRGEWGFKGLVMSDWGGSHSPVRSMYSGNDLIMPGSGAAEVINALYRVTPAMDVAGLPVYSRTVMQWGSMQFVRFTWQLNGLTLSATGSETVSTTVDETTDLSNPLSTDQGEPVSYASVDDAYQAVQALLSGSALNATQKAAIAVTDVVETDGVVTSYTVVMKGNYPSSFDMRLGDLQRSAANILNVAMQSAPFEELAANQGVDGISVGSYTDQFQLPEVLTVSTK